MEDIHSSRVRTEGDARFEHNAQRPEERQCVSE